MTSGRRFVGTILFVGLGCASRGATVADGAVTSDAAVAAGDAVSPELGGGGNCGLLVGDARLPPALPLAAGSVSLVGPKAFSAKYGSAGLARSKMGEIQPFVAAVYLTDNVLPRACAAECPHEAGEVLSVVVADRTGRPLAPGDYSADGFLLDAAHYERSADGAYQSTPAHARRISLELVEPDRLRGSFDVLVGSPGELITGSFDLAYDACWTPPLLVPGHE